MKKKFVIDTNVLVVANGYPDKKGKKSSSDCKKSAMKFLQRVYLTGIVLLDLDGEIQAEYQRKYRENLRRRGKLEVGDRFHLEVILQRKRGNIEVIELPKKGGEYQDLPREIIKAGFDRDDRKFAALAKKENVPVVNAVDSDWLKHIALLRKHGIRVRFVCGQDEKKWFQN